MVTAAEFRRIPLRGAQGGAVVLELPFEERLSAFVEAESWNMLKLPIP
jgi:hypothetical protein